MNDILSISFFASLIYLVIRFINMKYIEKETHSIKILFKDTLFVFTSIVLGFFILSQVTELKMTGGGSDLSPKNVEAFTGDADF